LWGRSIVFALGMCVSQSCVLLGEKLALLVRDGLGAAASGVGVDCTTLNVQLSGRKARWRFGSTEHIRLP
jgi:hypothetical protein